jgi:hypothetical protein
VEHVAASPMRAWESFYVIVGSSAAALTGLQFVVIGACGCLGVVYAVMVVQRARSQIDYQPVLEDWLFHAVLPMIAYAALLAAALTLGRYTAASLFVVGAVALLLLFVGIYNAWDTVTFIALNHLKRPEGTEKTE